MKKIIFFVFCLVFILTLNAVPVLAQETSDADEALAEVSPEVEIDAMVTAEDLDVKEPKILPNSRWYGLKKFWEKTKETLTFDPIKKAEMQMRHANLRLLEAKKVAEETGNEEIIAKATEFYEKKIEAVKKKIEKFKEKKSEKVDRFLDKFTDYQIKHRKMLERIEELSPKQKEKIIAVKERVTERLGEVLNSIDGEKIGERLDRVMKRIKGSNLKNLKNLEILRAIEEKVPEEARGAIRRAQENALKRFNDDMEEIPEKVRAEKVRNYIEKFKAGEVERLDIIEKIKESNVSQAIKSRMDKIRNRTLNRLEKKISETGNVSSQELKRVRDKLEARPALKNKVLRRKPQLMKNIEKRKKAFQDRKKDKANSSALGDRAKEGVGNSTKPKPKFNENDKERPCVYSCTRTMNPVCGDNGTTFDNPCFAKCAGVTVKYRGRCKKGKAVLPIKKMIPIKQGQ